MNQKNISISRIHFRRKAEELAAKEKSDRSEKQSEIDPSKLLEELRIQKIELELMYTELISTREQARLGTQKYTELYDFAPSGYFTLNRDGKIIELNVTGSHMLAREYSCLLNASFGFFVSDDTRPIFDHFLESIFKRKTKQTCELTLTSDSEGPTYIYLTGIITHDGKQAIVTMIDITDHKHTEQALRISEEQHRNIILRTAMDGFWMLDATGKILEVNDTYCRMSGYSLEELLSMSIADLEAYENTNDIASHIQKITTLGEDRFETRHRRKDGSTFDVEISAQFQYTRGGHFIVFVHDITEHKNAERIIKESEEKFRQLVLDMQVGVLIQGADTEILLSNPKALELLGLDEDHLLGKTSFDPDWNVIHEDGSPFPGDTHPVPQSVETRLPVREVVMGVYRPRTSDRVWLLVSAEPQLHADGTVEQVVCTFIDITRRKKAEESQRENERLLIESQTLAHIGSYAADMTAQTWKASPEIYEIFGIDRNISHSLLTWVDLIHPEHKEQMKGYFLQSGFEKNRFDQEYKIIRARDGVERWVHGLGVLESDIESKTIRMIGTIQDITERKTTEQELKQLNEELEERVKKRTAELIKSISALRETEEKYRTVADYTYDWEYWISAEGDLQYMSPSVERITGYTLNEFVTNHKLREEIVFADDLEMWRNHKQTLHKAVVDEEQDNFEFRIVTKSGDVRWIAHVCRVIYIDGIYKGIRVSNRDITERVIVENELLSVTVEVEERERNRFARELHDGLGPLLSIVKLYFQWLAETNDAEKTKIITEKGNQYIENAIQTTREVAHGLSSLILSNAGYVDTVTNLTKSINEIQKLHIEFQYNSNQRFSHLLETTLYRFTAELINNTLKYAGATAVNIIFNINKEKKVITFTYIDNGIGFDLNTTKKTSKGLGLMNIQQRIKVMRGNMLIDTGIGKGMKVVLEFPLNEVKHKYKLKNP